MKYNFETWLMQIYDLKTTMLTKNELALARKEYAEEYPPVGESEISLKTYPFKKYLVTRKKLSGAAADETDDPTGCLGGR